MPRFILSILIMVIAVLGINLAVNNFVNYCNDEQYNITSKRNNLVSVSPPTQSKIVISQADALYLIDNWLKKEYHGNELVFSDIKLTLPNQQIIIIEGTVTNKHWLSLSANIKLELNPYIYENTLTMVVRKASVNGIIIPASTVGHFLAGIFSNSQVHCSKNNINITLPQTDPFKIITLQLKEDYVELYLQTIKN